jgi:hypothetical protein
LDDVREVVSLRAQVGAIAQKQRRGKSDYSVPMFSDVKRTKRVPVMFTGHCQHVGDRSLTCLVTWSQPLSTFCVPMASDRILSLAAASSPLRAIVANKPHSPFESSLISDFQRSNHQTLSVIITIIIHLLGHATPSPPCTDPQSLVLLSSKCSIDTYWSILLKPRKSPSFKKPNPSSQQKTNPSFERATAAALQWQRSHGPTFPISFLLS